MSASFGIRKRLRNTEVQSSKSPPKFLRVLELDIIEHLEFFQAFIREPANVGALSPSSKSLAKAMIQGFALQTAETVVELGPGTGAFTGLIQERLGKRATFITVELDPIYANRLRRRFPNLIVYNDSAERMPEFLALHGKSKADFVISGLPWANLPRSGQSRILDAITSSLGHKGVFTTFAYFHARWLPKARQFRRNLEQRFARVEISPVVWRNLPPAIVYRCEGVLR